MKVFEIEVLNKETRDLDYILFDIGIKDNCLIALHEALTIEQRKSDKIAFKSVEIDLDFSLDEHLQDLYGACINAILNSDFYEYI
jgi:hypothetical protein